MAKRRGNKEGSIYKRGNRWCAQVSLNGRRLTKYFDTQRECREWIKETQAQIDEGTAVATPQTLDEFLDAWLETVKPSMRPQSHGTYAWNVRHHIIPGLGNIRLRELRPDHIQRYYATKLDEGTGASTVRMSHGVLRRALGHAVKWGLLTHNVSDAVVPPKAKTREMSVWDTEQIRCFLRITEDHRWDALFYLAVTTGLRQGELTGLYWSDLDWKNGRLRIQRQVYQGRVTELKTASSRRVVTLGEVALDKLYERQEHQARERDWGTWEENGFIFTSRRGSPVSHCSLYRVFIDLTEKAGLPRIRFHDLRHTAATLMLQQGVHPKVVQERLGHSSISMTLDTYSHVLPSLQEDVADRLDEVLWLQ